MKLIRFGQPGDEKPGIIDSDDQRRDVSAFCSNFDENFFASDGIRRLRSWLQDHEDSCPLVEEQIRWGSPVERPSKLICVGLNYAAHAAESGLEPPKEPVLFSKATSSVCGPFDVVTIPKGSEKTDWEVELAIVIGKKATYVSKEQAMDHIAGYLLHNDVSERAFQLEQGGQWVKGKSADTFAPLGPWLATTDEIADPNNLRLWLKVNGVTMQDSSTSDFIFQVDHLVSYISNYMSLLPGDVISTGTPQGVGLGQNPPWYLKPGDVMELGIDGLGVSKQRTAAYTEN